MSARSIISLCAAALALICVSCASFNTRDDYRPTSEALARGDFDEALARFPRGERKSFIVTMETACLSLMAGKPDIAALEAYSRKIGERVRYKVSRELQSFFYLDTPEGYYASEHEVIWMHLLLSWGYSQRGDFEKARVEVKRAANFIQLETGGPGRFDDPLLRIMCACMWMLCGDWPEAQVDFRAASRLDPKLWWARQLADMKTPPSNLVIVLGGIGPEPAWDPSIGVNLIRGLRGISFNGQGLKSALAATDAKNAPLSLHLSPDSLPWYRRHLARDNEIQEVIRDTRYAKKTVIASLKAAGIATGSILAGVLVGTGAIALGAGVVYVAVLSGSGEAIGGGIVAGGAIAYAGVDWGVDIGKGGIEKSGDVVRDDLDTSPYYRYVRFLPEYAWVGWSRQPLQFPIEVRRAGSTVYTLNADERRPAATRFFSFGYVPDADVSGLPGRRVRIIEYKQPVK